MTAHERYRPVRLDQVMVERGLVATRARARGLIVRGAVLVDGSVAGKAGQLVAVNAAIEIAGEGARYASLGAEKLILALESLGPAFDPHGRVALDVGASTGGFTDVLLRRGARRVYAVDVGRGQLADRLRRDPRVVALEATDARSLTENIVPESVTALVADVSFISLTQALAAPLALTAPGAWLIALVKPQFEAGREAVGKGGIVRDAAARADAVAKLRAWLEAQAGWRVIDVVPWPGRAGRSNEEYLIGAVRHA